MIRFFIRFISIIICYLENGASDQKNGFNKTELIFQALSNNSKLVYVRLKNCIFENFDLRVATLAARKQYIFPVGSRDLVELYMCTKFYFNRTYSLEVIQ